MSRMHRLYGVTMAEQGKPTGFGRFTKSGRVSCIKFIMTIPEDFKTRLKIAKSK